MRLLDEAVLRMSWAGDGVDLIDSDEKYQHIQRDVLLADLA